jgi:hypothetical protein
MSSTQTTFLPFIRHLKDFHRYRKQGNIFLEDNIYFRRLDYDKLLRAYRKLLESYDILRCNFFQNKEGLILVRLLPIKEFSLERISIDPDQAESYYHTVRIENAKLNIENKPLFRVLVNKFKEHIVLKFFVHHMLCDARSVQYLKNCLIKFYQEKDATHPYSFMDYASWRNHQYFKNIDYHHQFYLRKLSDSLVKPLDKRLTEGSLTNRLQHLSNGTYFNPTDEYSKKGCLYISKISINNPLGLSSKLKECKLPMGLLVFASFSNIITELFGEEQFIGYIIADRFHRMASRNIGEFTGEAILPASQVPATYEALRKVYNLYLQETRHLIFNYDLFGIQEEKLFRKGCRSFFNFTVQEEIHVEEEKINKFNDIGLIGLDLEPMFLFSPSEGLLYIQWRFNTQNISHTEMEQIANNFKSYLFRFSDMILKRKTQFLY